MLTRDIGTVVFRKERTHLTPIAPRFVSSPLRLRDEPEEPCLDLVTLMKSSHIDDMVLTREEEAEVDKLAEEFGDAVMDETMVQNDDLLVDEPGYDAEIISISQLSLENDVNNDNSVTSEAAKAPQPTKTQQTKNKSVVLSRTLPIGTSQGKMGGTKEKKKTIQSMELKGAQASKRLNALRGRPSPRKRGSDCRVCPFSSDKRYATTQVKAPPQLQKTGAVRVLPVLVRDIWDFEKYLFHTGACWRLCGHIKFPSKDIIQPAL
ncbi:hypothetical protein Bca52824_053069 [Brassica carinata]|uniref:Uncharacterized protein n=1 Tax=Brassica carinata TaxID=52824 RepID=A0A8X7UKJ7_BRACI|nr:hypothetical protein Bca52824_053069 [Brassica carinata]